MRRGLLILWIATLGADRIDFLAGAGPMLLRPLLVLIPVILVLESVALGTGRRRMEIPAGVPWFFVGQALLISLLLLSVIISPHEGLGVRRFALVAVEAFAALLVAIVLLNRDDRRVVLLRGAQLGLALILAFDIVQVIRWSGAGSLDWLALRGIVDLSTPSYGPWLPRPSGVSVDANRGGLLIIFYVYLVVILAPLTWRRSLVVTGGALLLLMTLSRSAMLMGAAVTTFWILSRGMVITHARVAALSLSVAAGAFAVAASRPVRDAVGVLGEVVASRISLNEGSASIHLSLLARGWDLSTSSIPNLLFGIGFGNSYLMLQDFFPGMKYGNFHSAYVSLLVEAGVGALAVFLMLLLLPLAWASTFAPLILGLVAFNVFYQAHVDAILWFVLALAWARPQGGEAERQIPASWRGDEALPGRELDVVVAG